MSEIEMKKSLVIQLTKRNLEILSVLEKWGIMGLGQLDGVIFHRELNQRKRLELFFKSVEREDYFGTAYKGITRLVKGGYVREHGYINLKKVYTLTGFGHAELRKNEINKLPSNCGEVAETMVRHELLVSAVGLVLSEILGLKVWTEMERYLASDLKNRTRKSDCGFPDLWVEDPVQAKAIEIERTQKSADRYEKLWQDYREELPPNAVVLYIACFPGGVKRLLSRAQKLGADHVYVCDLEQFKSSLGSGPFIGYRGGWIKMESSACRRHNRIANDSSHSLSSPFTSLEEDGELIR